MDHKKFNKYKTKEVIDWKYWKSIDKQETATAIYKFLKTKEPDIIAIQEFEWKNSQESYDFKEKMNQSGYIMLGNFPNYRASITVMFVKNERLNKLDIVDIGSYRNGRDYAVKIDDKYIIGTVHITPKYDSKYWDKIIGFYNDNKDKALLIIGDFNTFCKGTEAKAKFDQLLSNGAKDAWISRGNSNDVATEKKFHGRLDYAIASPSMYKLIDSYEILRETMNKMSDHAALLIELKE